jgi:CPA2 family monovalent cation:H+ antiporter-2
VVLPECETGLQMTRQALLHLRIPAAEVQRHTARLRHEIYGPMIASSGEYRTLAQFRAAEQQFDLHWVRLSSDSPLAGRTIADGAIRETTGASVVGVIREDRLEPNPRADFDLRGGDWVAIIGTEQARQAFEGLARARPDDKGSTPSA